jgi:hypothetical protein
MAHYDIFNGDADGICSLIQLRLAAPKDSTVITGVKRDIKLLAKANLTDGDSATVLDISMEKNADALQAALEAGASVFYADHHRSGDIPDHPGLEAHINTAPTTCTGLIVDYYLDGQYREWAIVAAYGDNIIQVADEYCAQLGLSPEQQNQLLKLGTAMNYNGYGSTEQDLYYTPEALYRVACQYETPFDFIANENEVYETLTQGYDEDMAKGLSITPDQVTESAAMVTLPDERWARRVSGVLGNELANQHPSRAHAILTEVPGKVDHFQISIRAPKSTPSGADVIATQFGGGGRKNAAGINEIAKTDLASFWDALVNAYS